jgi:hypothetical protein
LEDEFLVGGLTEGMDDPGVEFRQRAEDMLLDQTCGDRLRHEEILYKNMIL